MKVPGCCRTAVTRPAARLVLLIILAGCGLTAATSPRESAWTVLQDGASDKSADKRSEAILALGLIPRNSEARKLAINALKDDKAQVRVAGATALGEMHDRAAVSALDQALSDKDPAVVLAAAHALLRFRKPAAYDVYYAVLTGEQKTGKGVVSEQLKTLRDPKKMAEIGLETGLGFLPFADYGLSAVKMLTKDDAAQVRAAAATALTGDPDPRTRQALLDALHDESPLVRQAAIEALARRDRDGVLRELVEAMEDTKDLVRYTAAAAVIHLTDHR